MSNRIVYDSLLVHYLARELDERLRARRLRAVRMDAEHRRIVLELKDRALVWDLHPTRGRIRAVQLSPTALAGWDARKVRTQRRPRVRGVWSPPDERWLVVDIDAGGSDRASRFVVELMTNQWNALALNPEGTILHTLWGRETGGRTLRTGHEYLAPDGAPPGPSGVRREGASREGADRPVPLEWWQKLLEDVPPADRERTLLRNLAWLSRLNAGPLLGPGGAESPDLERSWHRYVQLASLPDARPRILEQPPGQPYPLPLPDVSAEPVDSLLEAFEAGADANAPVAPEVRSALEDCAQRARRRAARLQGEAEAAPARAERLRRQADLLMANLHALTKGPDSVELDDFEGGTVTVELDPAMTPAENAESLYDRARKRERAAARLPEQVRSAETEAERLESRLEQLEKGSAESEDVARWVEELRPQSGGRHEEQRLPYHRFRSSSGLEIRVGRSSRSNDDLTFHHSSPDDVWLHARDVAGAHVILRWPERDQNPPKRDLVEAAVLAALNSKARTSATVPVDWTRRTYVRKPRKAPPGAVLPDRVSTVFVEPDARLQERLAEE